MRVGSLSISDDICVLFMKHIRNQARNLSVFVSKISKPLSVLRVSQVAMPQAHDAMATTRADSWRAYLKIVRRRFDVFAAALEQWRQQRLAVVHLFLHVLWRKQTRGVDAASNWVKKMQAVWSAKQKFPVSLRSACDWHENETRLLSIVQELINVLHATQTLVRTNARAGTQAFKVVRAQAVAFFLF